MSRPDPLTQEGDRGGKYLLRVARQVALHRRPPVIADPREAPEDACEIEVPPAGLQALRVGEVDVGKHIAGLHEGCLEVGLLQVHVKDVAHGGHARAVHLARPAHRIGEGDRQAVLIPVDALDHQAAADPLRVIGGLAKAPTPELFILGERAACATPRQRVRTPEDRNHDQRRVELGAELDAPLIVVPIFGRTNALPGCGTGRTLAEDEELWRRGLREATDHAERVGGRLVVEGINRYENSLSVTLADAVRWAREMDSPSVAAMGDVFHMNLEEADLEASFVEAGDMLAYVHLADSQRLEPGRGHLDFASVFRGLSRIGYDGWASMECNLSGDPEEVLPAAVSFLRERIGATHAGMAT